MDLKRNKFSFLSFLASMILTFSLIGPSFAFAEEAESDEPEIVEENNDVTEEDAANESEDAESEEEAEAGIVYLALGDSVSAGQDPYKNIGDSFADLLAKKMESFGFLGSFSKAYAVPGYTTQNLLDDITNDVQLEDGESSIRSDIAKADLITISIGANDLLSQLDRTEAGISIDPEIVPELLEGIGANLQAIMTEIKTLNPTAQVYLMGYYHPFPYLPEELQAELGEVLVYLNGAIEKVAAGFGAVYVPTDAIIALDAKVYLPNPDDIHLSIEGYEVIAEEFWRYTVPYLTNNVQNEIFINGEVIKDDYTSIKDNTTFMHVRALFGALGGTVDWTEADNDVTIALGADEVIIDLDTMTATKNGEELVVEGMDLVDYRLIVPLRFAQDAFGVNIYFNPETKNILVGN